MMLDEYLGGLFAAVTVLPDDEEEVDDEDEDGDGAVIVILKVYYVEPDGSETLILIV